MKNTTNQKFKNLDTKLREETKKKDEISEMKGQDIH